MKDFFSKKAGVKSWAIFFLLVLLVFGKSINNGYCLDDEYVLENHEFVQKGIQGIPEILTAPHITQEESSFGYRPVVLISFALEYALYGENLPLHHFVNLLIYVFIAWLLVLVMQALFPTINHWLLIVVGAFFLIHPIHTEVVLSLKNRDVLLSALFGLIAWKAAIDWFNTRRNIKLLITLVCILLAFYSKKDAVSFVFIIPVSLYYLDRKRLKAVALIPAIFSGVFLGIKFLRTFVIDTPAKEIRDSYFFENPMYVEKMSFLERVPTAISSMFTYLYKFVNPYPLSFYYGYDEAEIFSWSDVGMAIVSILAIIALGWLVYSYVRSPRGWTMLLVVCVFPMLLVSNLVTPMPGIIAERFTFIPSLGFVALAALFLNWEKIRVSKFLKPIYGLFALVGLFFVIVSFNRTPDWKDRITLFEHDIHAVENSAKANELLATHLSIKAEGERVGHKKQALENEAMFYFTRAVTIYPSFKTALNNIGAIHFNRGQLDSAKRYYERALKADSTFEKPIENLGVVLYQQGNYNGAIEQFLRVEELDSMNQENVNRLLNAYALKGDEAQYASISVKAYHRFSDAQYIKNVANYYAEKGDALTSVQYFEFLYQFDRRKELCNHIYKIYFHLGDQNKIRFYQEELKKY